MKKVILTTETYEVTDGTYSIYIEIGHDDGDINVQLITERDDKEFVFDQPLDEEVIDRWQSVAKLIQLASKFLKEKYGKAL